MKVDRVALVGADGKLGPTVLRSLLSAGLQVTVLKRQSSTSASDYPDGVQVASVPDAFDVDSLVPVLQGHQAIVVTIKGSLSDVQRRLADAAVRAGVYRFIPADFGSCDSASAEAQRLNPLYVHKTELRQYLIDLAASNPGFTFTSLVCGHFFDWSEDFIHLYIKERRADVLDGGNDRFSISTLHRIAEATVRILQRPDETKNRVLYIQSFCVTQREIIAAFEKATGTSWAVRSIDSAQFEREEKAKFDAGHVEAVEELVWILGTKEADWTSRGDDFAMQLLELEDESLERVAEAMVQSRAGGS